MQQSRVGSKGELFPSKEIREKLKLNAHTKVTYKIEAGRLIVEPIPSLKEVLEEKPFVEITFEEFRKQRKELSTKAEI
jgi:bifunctional DNA-binding transcriptional regulator/antitoxin component of YhaV-PrlF toxin-antitoxin module